MALVNIITQSPNGSRGSEEEQKPGLQQGQQSCGKEQEQ